MTIVAVGASFALAALLSSCIEESTTPAPDNLDNPDNPDSWAALDNPYGIAVNPYNGDLIITTDGNYTAPGDCYVFNRDYRLRISGITLGALPSNAAALDNDHILVLNEGMWGGNNAEISLVDVAANSAVCNWFSANNGRGLGDVAQDIIAYGSKTYASVTFSNSIEIINNASGQSTHLSTTATAQKPRNIAAYEGNIYVTCYTPACVVRIDTATQSITGSCPLGLFNPEGICALNGKLYVCSSNISDESYNYSYDNKLYVVDINTFTLTDSITVGSNPNIVKAIDDNHLAVACWGDYASNPAGTFLVDVDAKSAKALGIALNKFDTYRGKIYGFTSYLSGTAKFYEIDPLTDSLTEIIPRDSI